MSEAIDGETTTSLIERRRKMFSQPEMTSLPTGSAFGTPIAGRFGSTSPATTGNVLFSASDVLIGAGSASDDFFSAFKRVEIIMESRVFCRKFR